MSPQHDPSTEVRTLFSELGVELPLPGDLAVEDPSLGQTVAHVAWLDAAGVDAATTAASRAFPHLRDLPAPARGELVRRMGERLRAHKEPLARLVCLEVGKGIEEARGEVQEMIDICDFACGLSRTVGGRTLPSERPGHRMMEQWHPLGPVLCITAFNFPVAVWSWNAAIALVCGDPIVWKPSPLAPLCAHAVVGLLRPIWDDAGAGDAVTLALCPDPLAREMVADPRYPLVSATGSCAMGRAVAPVVGARLGRCLLELGGNNAVVVDGSADLELASRAILFGAAGTAGQRCTTTRRLFVHREVADDLIARLRRGYEQLASRVGDPRDPNHLVGPLIHARARENFTRAITAIQQQGGTILAGGRALPGPGYFVEPTLVQVPEGGLPLMDEETFAPILYVRTFDELDQAIAWNNAVEQGLSSALFTDSVGASEAFLGPAGSDCGIANVNLGTSGAEIGGAFGGEKATGGGREAGSDAWKAYMRRQTCTINASGALPLAQGIRWD